MAARRPGQRRQQEADAGRVNDDTLTQATATT